MQFKAGQQFKEVIYSRKYLLELDLAYAITIHKSQGSEFETIIIPLITQHFGMLFRNLVYTGITRAKKLVVFVGTRKRWLWQSINRIQPPDKLRLHISYAKPASKQG